MRPDRPLAWHALARRLCCLAALACAHPGVSLANPCTDPGDGMGGTGVRSGAEAARGSGDEDGMGGTGVVGVITGFGSICVNGLEIHYESATPVTVDGEPASASALRIGHVVAVEASGSGKELKARAISVLHELSGTVTAVDAARDELRVLGQPVSLRALRGAQAAGVRPGDSVRVSGMRGNGGEVLATLIEPAGASAAASVRGPIQHQGGDTALVGGVRVRLASGGKDAADGSAVLVSGSWNGSELRVQRLMPDPATSLLDRVTRIDLRGIVQKSGKALSISGVPIDASGAGRGRGGDALHDGESAHVTGTIANGSVRASDIRIERGDAGASRDSSSGRADSGQGAGKSGKAGTIERPEHTQEHRGAVPRPDRPERIERPERIDRPDRVERPERPERVERPEAPERVERTDR